MGVKWQKVSHIDAVLKQVSTNAEVCMPLIGEAGVNGVHEQMLYGYHTPHGLDGHTEIVDTEKLFDSITYDVQKSSQNAFTVNVGVPAGTIPAQYAQYVHDGTWKLEGRPFITDGVLNSTEKQEEIYKANLPNGFR